MKNESIKNKTKTIIYGQALGKAISIAHKEKSFAVIFSSSKMQRLRTSWIPV